jgi:hypothetical protein
MLSREPTNSHPSLLIGKTNRSMYRVAVRLGRFLGEQGKSFSAVIIKQELQRGALSFPEPFFRNPGGCLDPERRHYIPIGNLGCGAELLQPGTTAKWC